MTNKLTPRQAREQMELAAREFGRNSQEFIEKEKQFYQVTTSKLENDPDWETFNEQNPNPGLLRFLTKMKEKHGIQK